MELVAFILIGAGVFYSWVHGDQSWRTLGQELGLAYTNPALGTKKLHGRLRGFDVQISQVNDNNEGKKYRIKVAGVDAGFTLGKDSAFQRMIKPDIETGDQVFDERTRIEGDASWALALLSVDARRLTEIVISGWNGELKGNTLVASYKSLDSTASTLDTVLDLAQRLRRPAHSELPRLLTERVFHDPSSAVRLQAFRRMVDSPRLRKEAIQVAEKLLASPGPFLKLEACRVLLVSSPEKRALAAKELAAIATQYRVDSSVRRSAIEMLAHSRDRAAAVPTMSKILRGADAPIVRTAALEGLIRIGARSELLEARVENEAEAEILAKGLGHFDVSAQPRLLELLQDFEDRTRLAAVRSLGQVGDVEAIRHLRQVAGKDRLFKSSLAREAENAIQEIKGRSDGSQQGEISIIKVAPLEGAVSPSDDSEAGGEVSLTP